MDNKMFCYQCEQTAGCGGCTGAAGVCGKTADVAKLQDELTGALVALARGIHEAPEVGTDTWRMMIEGLFATVTNVDFNEKTLRKRIAQVHKETERLCGQGDDYSMENVWNAHSFRCARHGCLYASFTGTGLYGRRSEPVLCKSPLCSRRGLGDGSAFTCCHGGRREKFEMHGTSG